MISGVASTACEKGADHHASIDQGTEGCLPRRLLVRSVALKYFGASLSLVRPWSSGNGGQLSPEPKDLHSVVREPRSHHGFGDAAHGQRVLPGRIWIHSVVPAPDQLDVSRSFPQEVLERLLWSVFCLQGSLKLSQRLRRWLREAQHCRDLMSVNGHPACIPKCAPDLQAAENRSDGCVAIA